MPCSPKLTVLVMLLSFKGTRTLRLNGDSLLGTHARTHTHTHTHTHTQTRARALVV